ncbi:MULTISPECIES: hypothetical protein [unclassified Paenibacillus]|uniref:hypothetical protein n=1 Tax=unclassified Paenibacillus TaxID=185978 RepID=UPI0008AEC1F1|nr:MULTISPECIES: hypothetical protein [unclassified Paenibacillus]QLG39964.1 hypothetical protein HW560_18875 [Paenibacillus sp. E222]SEN90893.1 hypothetical protein SAMN05518670_3031 [Paenibacillus sp. OK076]
MALKKILTASVLSLALLSISVPVMASQASDVTIMNKQKSVTVYQDYPSNANIPSTYFYTDADHYYGTLQRTNIVQVTPSQVRAYYSGIVTQDSGF